ncbi:hypothetical protein EOT10_07080 [Streptomyces antnestii]|uniref:Uncharacterized protein n=1 Tax=Streptomyces antnestii TaxID=2494256 RepID=A0A3S2VKE2_9ACTN|nr:hypothetical protein [Streptomyces sp. San01]RVU28018.1 hypothetical protein EOT10_07080 [Streptomyces sp. San01]
MDGEQWLAACHPDPAAVYRQWGGPPHLARLPTGKHFAALRLFQPLGLTVLWELGDQADKVPVLEEHARPRPFFYLLMQPTDSDSDAWPSEQDATFLGAGDEFTAPSPHADGITGVQQHSFMWRVAPDGSGRLADPDALRAALRLARDCDRQAARIRAARSVFYGAKHTKHTRQT